MPNFEDVPLDVVQSISTYAPLEPVADLTRDYRRFSCNSRPTEYRTQKNSDGSCPTVEASHPEPDSMCCSSRGPTNDDTAALEYMAYLRKVALRSSPSIPHFPDGIGRLLYWMTHPSNAATFPAVPAVVGNPNSLIFPLNYPYLRDVFKLALMLKSDVRLFIQTTIQTERMILHFTENLFAYIYPDLLVHKEMVDAINEVGVDTVRIDLRNVAATVAPLPYMNTETCMFLGNSGIPLRVEDVTAYFAEGGRRGWRQQLVSDAGRLFAVVESTTTVLEAFRNFLQVQRQAVLQFGEYTNQAVPAGYTAVEFLPSIRAFSQNLMGAVGGTSLLDYGDICSFFYGEGLDCSLFANGGVCMVAIRPT